MSGPRNDRGDDVFGDFFGDPTPSGRMRPGPAEPDPRSSSTDETQRMAIGGEDTPVAPMPAAEQPTELVVPTGAVPEAWWDTESHGSAAAAGAASAAGAPWQDSPARPDDPAPRRNVSPASLVAMLIGGVLLGGLCVGGALMAFGGDDEPVAGGTTVTTTSPPSEPSDSSEASDPAESDSTTSESSSSSSSSADEDDKDKDDKKKDKDEKDEDERSGKLPAGASKCAGPSSGVSVASGTDVTSCDFAVAVRDAYVADTGGSGNTTLRVTSPVTGKAYTMRCSGKDVTRCTGGNNAVVVLY